MKTIIAAIIIVILIYFGLSPFVFGEKKMKSICSQIISGQRSIEVHKLIEKYSYKIIEKKEGNNVIITIIDSKAMGRFICEVVLNEDKVVEAKYIKND